MQAQAAANPPAVEPGIGAGPNDPDEQHRRALELREYRMGRGGRPAGVDAPRSQVTGAGTIATTFPVMGMTCRSCEVRISTHVGRLPNVERVSASAVKGQVVVESSAPVSAADIEKAINKAGYEIGRTPWLVSDPTVWATAGLGVLLVAALAVVASKTGIGDLANGAGDLSQGGVLVALLLGLAAGVSTCMALVGGLVLGLSAAFGASRPAGSSAATQLRPALVFVGGRIVGYAVLGGVLGAVGASVTMPPPLTATLMIGVAIVMLLLGTRLTGISPRLAGWSPTLPMGMGNRLGLGGDGTASPYSDTRAASLGAASFFLPCGFTQAIQIFALSTGSPVYAAALLGTFAIGTAPGLLAVAGLPLVVPSRAKPTLLRLVGVVVIGFALLNGSAGLRLSGFSLPALVGSANAAPLPGLIGADGVERFTTFQDAAGYSPANLTIYAGYPVEWTVQSSSTSTCAASLWAPGVNIRARLKKGPNTFSLPALPAGVLRYTCSMGMYAAQITVVPAPADGTGATGSTNPGAQASTAPGAASSSGAATAAQELRTYQDENGYGPADAPIRSGVPTKWHIDSRSQYSCSSYLVVPDLGISLALQPGDNVIDLPALPAGRLDYTCGMGMYRGSIAIGAGA
jgi:sulfite exporter TauE/SafE/plastocyanin domain-containing protein/copper chaperone CopZ